MAKDDSGGTFEPTVAQPGRRAKSATEGKDRRTFRATRPDRRDFASVSSNGMDAGSLLGGRTIGVINAPIPNTANTSGCEAHVMHLRPLQDFPETRGNQPGDESNDERPGEKMTAVDRLLLEPETLSGWSVHPGIHDYRPAAPCADSQAGRYGFANSSVSIAFSAHWTLATPCSCQSTGAPRKTGSVTGFRSSGPATFFGTDAGGSDGPMSLSHAMRPSSGFCFLKAA